MKLISRRKSPSPPQKAFNVVKLALRGLAVQRIARNAFKAYKLVRRLPVIIGGAAVAAFALKKLRGSGDGGPETWTAPPAAPAPEPIQTAGGTAVASTPSTATSPPSTASEPATPASGTSADAGSSAGEESPVETAAVGTPPVGPEAEGGPSVPSIESDGAPDPDIAAAAAATDAGTTDGGSAAAGADADDTSPAASGEAEDPAAAIGDDLAAAAEGGSRKEGDEHA